MKLALETSTDICSVALLDDVGTVHEKRTSARGTHSEQLFLFIDELKKEHGFGISDLEAVIVSEGPGSYTGLRISASAVKGLLFGQSVPLFAANTLAAFAAGAVERQTDFLEIHSVIDARRTHLYHQQFSFDGSRLVAMTEVEVRPIKIIEKAIEKGHLLVGTGIPRLDEQTRDEAASLGKKPVSAVSILDLLQLDSEGKFIRKVLPEGFEPKYYSSRQVSG